MVETCDFHRVFGKRSKDMLILTLIPSYKHNILSNILVIGKIKVTEFHQPPPPPTNDFDDSPYSYDTLQISIHICETMHYRVSIDYI